jgi:hypothetical protein
VRRWLVWFVLAPQSFVLAGVWSGAGLPPVDMAVLACSFLVLYAQRSALPGLLLGFALGRALVDEASLPVQILVLGVPVAVLLPLRTLLFGHRWSLQVVVAGVCAVGVPRLAALCGRVFAQPSASGVLTAADVLWAMLLAPPLVWLLRRLPPCAAFVERKPEGLA